MLAPCENWLLHVNLLLTKIVDWMSDISYNSIVLPAGLLSFKTQKKTQSFVKNAILLAWTLLSQMSNLARFWKKRLRQLPCWSKRRWHRKFDSTWQKFFNKKIVKLVFHTICNVGFTDFHVTRRRGCLNLFLKKKTLQFWGFYDKSFRFLRFFV